MSTQTGTATSYLDLLSKLRTFLTTDATLVAAGQNWTELATNSTPYVTGSDTVDFETYLRAPGLSGSEAIYINIRAYHNTPSDYYNWEMRGASGYVSSSGFIAQPNTSLGTFAYMWNSSIPYWFIANGQRVIVVAKVSTVYESMYLGKILPYGTPAQYPYPLFIGGSNGIPGTMDLRFSDTTGAHQSFTTGGGYLCNVDSSWLTVQNFNTSLGNLNVVNIWPHVYDNSQRPTWLQPNLDGSYPLFAMRIEESSPSINEMGEFDGVFYTSGVANGSENTITVGSTTHTVFQNAFRTTSEFYFAVKMA